jgi:hypothetical protein
MRSRRICHTVPSLAKREAVEFDVFVVLMSRSNVLERRQTCLHGGAARGFRDDHHLWTDHVYTAPVSSVRSRLSLSNETPSSTPVSESDTPLQ